MYNTKKRYYYYFANGKVVISKKVLSIIDVAEFEACYGKLYYSEFCWKLWSYKLVELP